MNNLIRRVGLMSFGAALVVFALATAARAGDAAPAKKDSAPALTSLLESAPADQRDRIVRAAASASVAGAPAASIQGGPACVPSPKLAPGQGFSPQVNDKVRFDVITDLLDRIAACKPLPYAHDGIVNNNREGLLPKQPAGYYLEYTLKVPGRQTGDGPVPVDIGGKIYMTGQMLSARGPERIIVGGRERIYYTPDHYKNFIELTIVR
ncbi:MAG: hypothetical protein NTY77_08650 [Elusimicrobia bacterium]|nr:hypothetical protein [Elusimicrobiota bacterium]